MAATAHGVGLEGIDGVPVEVQVANPGGLPGFDVTGLPQASLREARHRVRSAVRASGYEWPQGRIVVNLAPADLPKAGAGYDLPVALGVLAHDGLVPREALVRSLAYGELGLDGRVRALRGAVSAALAARAAGLTQVLVARDSASEAASVPGVSVIGVGCLAEAVDHLRGDVVIAPTDACPVSAASAAPSAAVDLALVRGQSEARRALEVAAAGGHNLLFVGPPGCGKTLLARTLPGLLPPMALEECLEVTQIHSASGRGAGVLLRRRPFRAPHASASDAALVGGGQPPVPGEVSLAHRGVLFLDETPEFRRSALEALRAPLEDREVFIARASRRVRFPSAVTLVCAMNPCPCGYATDPTRPCRCTPRAVAAYAQRLSGPLLDRIDLHVELAPVAPERLASPPDGEDTATVRARVVAARARQLARNDVAGRRVANADLTMASLERFAPLGPAERRHLTRLARSYGLTARSWGRVIRVARTLADLVGAEAIEGGHLSEAVTYRRLLVEHERRRGGPRPGRRRPGGSPAGGSASAG